jgi:hypothetical protein
MLHQLQKQDQETMMPQEEEQKDVVMVMEEVMEEEVEDEVDMEIITMIPITTIQTEMIMYYPQINIKAKLQT